MINLVADSKQDITEFDDYEINATFGFLPESEPLKRLPAYYSRWEIILDDLPTLITSNKLRILIKGLPTLSIKNLSNGCEYRRAFLVLSFLTHAYVFGDNVQETLQVLPACLAVPFCLVANHLKMRPVVCASSVCLWNWSLIDVNSPAELDNLKINHTFTSTRDEEWFYLITTSIELLGGECISSAMKCLSSILDKSNHGTNEQIISAELNKMTKLIQKINILMSRMYDYCDPKIFYNNIRPFLSGWLNMEHKGLPKGLYYEGTENLWDTNDNDHTTCWKKFAGGSAGQAPLVQFIDVFLGIDHYPTTKEWKETYLLNNNNRGYVTYLMKMREYMTAGHRQLLFDMSEVGYNLRTYINTLNQQITATSPFTDQQMGYPQQEATLLPKKEIIDYYNMCVNGMKSFRDIHLQVVSRYIVVQSSRRAPVVSTERNKLYNAKTKIVEEGIRGTGGTDLIPFLKQCRDETSVKMINNK